MILFTEDEQSHAAFSIESTSPAILCQNHKRHLEA